MLSLPLISCYCRYSDMGVLMEVSSCSVGVKKSAELGSLS